MALIAWLVSASLLTNLWAAPAVAVCEGGKGTGPHTELVPGGVAKAALVPRPPVVSRVAWGCSDGSGSPGWAPQFTTVTHLIVHHSAGANSANDWSQVVGDIWSFHSRPVAQNGRGWGDIGYNYLIDPNGIIYEGRAGGDNVIGAHFACVNGGTMGVCLLGTFTSAQPSAAALESLQKILAWKAGQRGIAPTGVTFHPGAALLLPNISGHRHANDSATACGATECPGDRLFALLPSIRDGVKAMLDGDEVVLPTVETLALQNITTTTAVLRGKIQADGGGAISDRRFDWGTGTPLSQFVLQDKVSVSGNEFTTTLTGLQPGTTYFYRAWARNNSAQTANGLPAGWGIGQILSFTTASVVQPNIEITGGSVVIAPGDTTPSTDDKTDLRRNLLGEVTAVQQNYLIKNRGAGELRFTGGAPVTLTGSDRFQVIRQPTGPVAAGGFATSVGISFANDTVGVHTATVSVHSNDPDQPTYSFQIRAQTTRPNRAPVVALDTPASGQQFTAPANLLFQASASDPDAGDPDTSDIGNGKIRRVEFYSDTTQVGSVNEPPFAYSWNGVPAGTYRLRARVVDQGGLSAESSTVTVTVDSGTPNSWTVTSSAGPNGTVIPAGVVTVPDGSSQIFAAMPEEGYSVEQWKVDGTAVQTGSDQFTLANVHANRSVQVTFKRFASASIVRLGTVTGAPGSSVTVPVELVSQGTENALGFSVAFDAAKLTFTKAELGADGVGAQLVPNISQIGSGRVGLAVARAAGQAFTAGVRQVLKLEFAIKAGLVDTSVPLTIGDNPITREVSDVTANELPAEFQAGTVNVVTVVGFEADVAPRPNGNGDGTVKTTDWVQVGRFAAGLDTAAAGNEFQRADCAPRATVGDGRLTTTDWVQAGRYAAGLDPVAPAGGPVVRAATGGAIRRGYQPAALTGREVILGAGNMLTEVGEILFVPVSLNAQGNENAFGFSVHFDPSRLSYRGFTAGKAFASSAPIINAGQQGEGKVGILQALPSGQSLATGFVIVGQMEFHVLPPAAGQKTEILFGDTPVAREVSDATANILEVTWVGGSVTVPGPQPKRLTEIGISGNTLALTLNGTAGEWLALETSANLRNWTAISTHLIPESGSLRISVPLTAEPQGHYRAVQGGSQPITIQPGPTAGKDIWTTSMYSYAEGGGGPGGGRDNYQLRVGGWGDLYYSLLEFDLSTGHTQAESAVLYLYCYHTSGGGTPMDLYRITEPWDWRTQGTGADRERLWWADRPPVEMWNQFELPAPTAGKWYAIDITDLYRAWKEGSLPNYGLQLQPLLISGNNFNEFYSADYAEDPSLRPRIVITPP